MKKLLTLTIFAAMLALGASGARADGPFPANLTNGTYGPSGLVTPNDQTGEVEIYQAVNTLLGTSYTNNAAIDSLEYTGNASNWVNNGNGGYAVIGLGAGAANTLDVYNSATPGSLITPFGPFTFTGNNLLGNGTFSSPYPATGAVFSPGTQYGFALDQYYHSIHTDWYSDPTLNSDGMDHMLVYNLSSLNGSQVWIIDPNTSTKQLVTLNNPYLLTFEDTTIGNNTNGAPSDLDYNDLMVLISGVSPSPVPEPMTYALFGIGLLALAGFALRRKLAFQS